MNEVSRKNEDKENIKLNNKKSVSLVKDSISLKKNPVPSSPKLNKHLNLREYSIEIKRFLKEEIKRKQEEKVIENNNQILPQKDKLGNKRGMLDFEYKPEIKNHEKILAKKTKFHERVKDTISRVNKKKEFIKEKIQFDEKNKIKQKEMSNNAKKIINKKLKERKPIHLRIDEIVKSKNREIKQLKEINKEKQEAEIILIKNRSVPCNTYDKEKFDSWVDKKNDWNKKKNIKIKEEKIKNDTSEKEKIKGLFHPLINRKSEVISKKFCEMPAYIRLNDKENFLNKLSKKVINEEYPFKPELTLAIPNYRYLENTSKEKRNTSKLENSVHSKGKSRNFDRKFYNQSADNIKESDYDSRSLIKGEKLMKNIHVSFDEKNKQMSSKTAKSDNFKAKFQIKSIRILQEIDDLENLKEGKKNPFDYPYKINSQFSSSCDKNRENKLILPSKFRHLVKTILKFK